MRESGYEASSGATFSGSRAAERIMLIKLNGLASTLQESLKKNET